MLDWFSGHVGYDASKLELGRVVKLDRYGEVEYQREGWETARGSWESGVQVTRASATEAMLRVGRDELGYLCADQVLRISGNPSKFLQGHNAAGPSVSLLGPVLQAVVRLFPRELRPADAASPVLPSLQRSCVDVTTHVDLGRHEAVHEWLLVAAALGKSRHGRAQDSSGTVYWGKNSRRWTLKAYCKHCDLPVHPPDDRELLPDLLEWTRPHLRLELRLRRPELKDRGSLHESIIWEFVDRVEFGAMKTRNFAKENLPARVRSVLQQWLDGHDVATLGYSRATLYRYRKIILADGGPDFFLPMAAQEKTVRTVLTAAELRAREVREMPERVQRSLFGASI